MTDAAIEIPTWLAAFQPLLGWIVALPILVHFALVAAAQITFSLIGSRLKETMSEAHHPEQSPVKRQTTFSAKTLTDWLSTMRDMESGNTLNIFRQGQLIDLAFIAAYGSLGLLAGSLFARFGDNGSSTQFLGFFGAACVVTAALFDLIEDMICFMMIRTINNHVTISQGVAVAYSTMASIKIALLIVGGVALLLSVLFSFFG